MKGLIRLLAIPTSLAIALGTVGTVLSQNIVAITPSSQTVELTGTSGGSNKASNCAGYISPSPNHVIKVSEDINLQLTLQAAGEPSLMIRNPSGQDFCVPSDSLSGGKVVMPGRLSKGTYQVYVGDRSNGHYPYTLSISTN